MAQNFFDRLRSYYLKVAEVLRGEADAASVFANTTDIGMSRELAYAEFLKQHAPSKCNVLLGGFLFDDDGAESKQLDIIITTDTAPRFNFHNKDGSGKSFSPVEGTLGVVSVKSTLNRAELFDALGGIASIPPTRALDGRVNVLLKIKNYDDWPVKIVYASKGIAPETLLAHINEYYGTHPEIPLSRRPNFVHVAGSCLIVRAQEGMTLHDRRTGAAEPIALGTYHLLTTDSDLQAIVWTLNQLQQNASASTHILLSYDSLINKVSGLHSVTPIAD
ncbi:hypothetical protein QSH18_10780 [Xanthomonas sp. NCPPB 2654]|uniref:DUF6602 domain-containing protein n=1 Tax=unclassified Xanthomonas TaxID=2643310 RepID=UPI0021E053BE|nr:MULTISPECIES: DUF6602 domain-containing protein [unclassified Xanthomonas]MDL5366090.1 hypothetical protein [Xanthomonas sp. NCPPB 2654]UYC20787.1 hypothetical protein NUG20_00280 [Xanthomonas sp. CFBP 8443]